MSTETVSTDLAPAAIGPYSQAIVANGFVFTAGQIGLDPATGALVPGGVVPETKRALQNLLAVLEAAGSGPDRIVKTTVFLADLGDYADVNALYAEAVASPFPARSAVQVAALPKGARVEIEAIAVV